MSEAVPIRGVACPYRQWATLKQDCVFERIMDGAFGRMLQRKRDNISFLIGGHDGAEIASTAAGNASLFEAAAVGLCFEIWLDADEPNHLAAINSIVRYGCNRASVQFTKMGARHVRRERESEWQSFFDVDIDHVAITYSAAFPQTAVWRADCSLERAPGFIQRSARDWAFGEQNQFQSTRQLSVSHLAKSNASPTVSAALAQRQPLFADIRRDMAKVKLHKGQGFGRAAFNQEIRR